MNEQDNMTVQARVFYSEWQRKKWINMIQFQVVLNWFERQNQVAESQTVSFNTFSKMKLLFNLSGQGPEPRD